MQQSPGKRALALVAALAFATAGSALAQDTTETGQARFDTTETGVGAIDTAGVDTADTTGSDTTGMDRAVTDTAGVPDTSAAGGTSDTSGVQNPPGYRGMERDTTMFPPEGGPPATPEEAAGQTTGTYGDSAWRDTSGAAQNPPGYRGMEEPAGADSAGGHTGGHDTTQEQGAEAGDTTGQTPE